MKQVNEYSLNNTEDVMPAEADNIRACPCCGHITLKGMPGGRDAICANCGYKDPCCSE